MRIINLEGKVFGIWTVKGRGPDAVYKTNNVVKWILSCNHCGHIILRDKRSTLNPRKICPSCGYGMFDSDYQEGE